MQRLADAVRRLPLTLSALVLVCGGAVDTAVRTLAGTAATAALTLVGIAGVALVVNDLDYRPLVRLCRRLWFGALVLLVPYGLTSAPNSPAAAEVGALLAVGPVVPLLGGLVWAFQMGAVTATVFVGIAVLRREFPAETPEERILNDDLGL